MKVKLAKWGNSLAVRIPATIATDVSLKAGSTFEVTVAHGALHLRPLELEPCLDELLSAITPNNLHGEIDFGTPVGKEAW
jgi:antitoxin MazE